MHQQSFEKFYYTKVGFGEGCGCAKRVIDNHEIERIRAGLAHRKALGPGPLGRFMQRLFRRNTSEPAAKD